MSDAIMNIFLYFRNSLKIYHWKTRSYSRHVASDAAVTELDGLIDKFMEAFIGRYERNIDYATKLTLAFDVTSDDIPVMSDLELFREMLFEVKKRLNESRDTDLFNLLDEMAEVVDRTLYLFRLK